MAKNLTDLTERTTTADTDLLHINSGGTDYKETKANFLKGELYYTFDNTSLLTTQVENLPATATYFGVISSYGHQTETGVPTNSSYYVKATKAANGYAYVEIWSTSNAETNHYINTQSNGTWTGWISSIRGGLATISSGNSRSFTVANNSRILLLDIGASAVRSGMWMIYVGGTGTPTIVPVGDIGNLVSISGSTNTITIQNTASTAGDFTIHAIVFVGSITAN